MVLLISGNNSINTLYTSQYSVDVGGSGGGGRVVVGGGCDGCFGGENMP